MDPASLALGVLPVVGGAIQAYRSLQKTFKAYCHYSRDVRRLRKHFNREEQFFLNETQLLIRPAGDDDAIVECMIGDSSHPSWLSDDLEKRLRKYLGKSYNVWQGILEDVNAEIETFKAKLQCFDEIALQRQMGESLKDTVRRLRHKVKISFDKDRLEANIDRLRSFNHDLERLRKQAETLQNRKSSKPSTGRQQKPISQEYRDFNAIKEASKALHHAFAGAWCNTTTSEPLGDELRHNVKLFADAKVEDGVHLDVAIICYGHDSSSIGLTRPSLRKLQVHSQVLDWVKLGLNTPPRSEDGRHKRRKVHFTDDCSARSNGLGSSTALAMPPTPESSDTQPMGSGDLSGKYLSSTFGKDELCLPCTQISGCLGYIESCSEEIFRHSFYEDNVGRSNSSAEECALNLQDLVSMDHILSQPVEDSLTIVNQLKLARDIIAAVLKFHSTPWVGPYMAIDDISFFKIGPSPSGYLQTLHFGVDFVPGDRIKTYTAAQTATLAAYEEGKFQHGVRNLTLWSLGTILLQIGRWNRIESPGDVATIRKLSSQVSALGPRYQELTKRCLECDFGHGEDLSKPHLHRAVYENLVRALSDMISSLDLTI